MQRKQTMGKNLPQSIADEIMEVIVHHQKAMETYRKVSSVRVTVTRCDSKALPAYVREMWDDTAYHGYKVTLRYGRRRMTVPYMTDTSVHPDTITAISVLASLMGDASYADLPFNMFAWDYGYDPGSRVAALVWHALQKNTRRVKELLGDDFDAFESYDWESA